MTDQHCTARKYCGSNRRLRKAAWPHADAARHLAAFRAQLPQAIAASRAQAEADRKRAEVQRYADGVVRAGMTEQQRYREEVLRVKQAITETGLSHADAKRHLDAYRASLPSAVAAERQRSEAMKAADDIRRKSGTDQQLYREEVLRVKQAIKEGGLAHADAARHQAAFRAQLPQAVAAERQHADAMRQAAAIVRQNETATERYRRQLAEVSALHRRGTLDTQNYGRELRRLSEEFRRRQRIKPARSQPHLIR